MKVVILTIALCGSILRAEQTSPLLQLGSRQFLTDTPDFNAFPTSSPYIESDEVVAAQLADLKFSEKYGACGITKLKSRIQNKWVFGTFVGYGGAPGDDIVVELPKDAIEAEFLSSLSDLTPIRLTRR